MPHEPLKLIVLARDQSSRVQNAWSEMSEFLEQQDNTEIVAAAVTEDLDLDGLDADLVVVLGGDGAILRACRQLDRHQLPIVGVNLGRLGFLAELTPDEFRDSFPKIQQRQYEIIEHLMFECRLNRADGSTQSYLGLNEVAVSAAASLRMIDIDLAINGETVTTYGCDGLIVSTPVGSTAHSLSAGGPILRQNLHAFVITPICPHTLTNRPLVDNANEVFTLRVPDVPDGVMLVIDGQIRLPLESGDTIDILKAPVSFQLAKISGRSYYNTLHHKLGWGSRPRYQPK